MHNGESWKNDAIVFFRLRKARQLLDKELPKAARELDDTQHRLDAMHDEDSLEVRNIQDQISAQRQRMSAMREYGEESVEILVGMRDFIHDLRSLTREERGEQLRTIERVFTRGEWTSKELDEIGWPSGKDAELKSRSAVLSKQVDELQRKVRRDLSSSKT